MKKNKLFINEELLDKLAKERFVDMAKGDEHWEEISQKLKAKMKPECIYTIFTKDEMNAEGNQITVAENTFHCDVFEQMPREIIGDMAVYLMTLGNTTAENNGILSETLTDMAQTAYLDALRDMLRMELQEEYIVSGGVAPAPGLDGMPIEEIKNIDDILDFSSLGVTLNEYCAMTPEKSTAGLYIFFKEEHPVNTNSCATCMARGHGCDFCMVGKEN